MFRYNIPLRISKRADVCLFFCANALNLVWSFAPKSGVVALSAEPPHFASPVSCNNASLAHWLGLNPRFLRRTPTALPWSQAINVRPRRNNTTLRVRRVTIDAYLHFVGYRLRVTLLLPICQELSRVEIWLFNTPRLKHRILYV